MGELGNKRNNNLAENGLLFDADGNVFDLTQWYKDLSATDLNELKVAIGSSNLDGFGRVRVSQATAQYDQKQLYDSLPLFINQELIGTATATHSAEFARTQLAVSATSDAAIMQTKQKFNYRSGKSQQLFWTFNNLGDSDITINIQRSGTSVDSVARASWDDPLDGTGRSGRTHDFDNNTIMMVDFEWLGVGNVRWFIVKDGVPLLFHEVDHTDEVGVYMSSPNQPLRWELRQTGASAYTSRVGYFNTSTTTPFNTSFDGLYIQSTSANSTLDVICASVNTEGAMNILGRDGGAEDDGVHLNANSTSEWYVAAAIRLKSDRTDTLVDVLNASLLAETNDSFSYRICMNPTYAGTLTYNSIDNFSVEYSLGVTANTVSAFGTTLKAGYGYKQSVSELDLETAIRLGSNIDGSVDELVLIVKPFSTNLDLHRSINWRELS